MEILGYVGALAMGLSLGLLGGGGSILTVPILVYLFGLDAIVATSYSLFIVGLTSLTGSFSHFKIGNINWKIAAIFGIPALASVYISRVYILPAIPETLLQFGTFELSKSSALLLLFAVLMVLASISMLKKEKIKLLSAKQHSINYTLLAIEGFVVGLLTGLVGAGGGFLIIPALVIMAKLPIKKAIGTSLLIITSNSLFGFLSSFSLIHTINWSFLFLFSSFAIVGILIGSQFCERVSSAKLKPAFGWFVLLMGCYILLKETIL